MNTHTHSEIGDVAVLDATDDLLSDLELTVEGDTDEEVLSALTDLSIEDEAAIEIAGETADAYIEQEVSTTGVEAVESEAPVKVKKARAAKAASEPKAPKDLASIADDVFDIDGVTTKTDVIALMPTQKKIAEKFVNLFQKVSVNSAPSTYVMQCLDVLNTHGEATASDMIAALKASSSRKGNPYSQGTAASQVGQIMSLFSTVKIATREGQKLVLNRTSPLTVKLLAIASAPVAAAA
jgi:hypothetical protein